MRFTAQLGSVSSDGTTLQQAERIQMLFEADATITPGKTVALDTGNTAGKLVVTTPVSINSRIVGVYEGEGGTGAQTTTSGLTGNSALDGDLIWVTVYGVATALLASTSTAFADGDSCVANADVAGVLQQAAASATATTYFVALEALTTGGTGTAKKVFVRGV